MGLGKRQALAHVLTEKEAGRLSQPALVVMPTSLVFNWVNKPTGMAPGLRVLVLHGADRDGRMDEIAQADLVISTYPLIWRDVDKTQIHPVSFADSG